MSQLFKHAYSISEVVQSTGICRTTIYEEIKSGKLVAKKCGARTIITESDLQAWLDALPSTEIIGGKNA